MPGSGDVKFTHMAGTRAQSSAPPRPSARARLDATPYQMQWVSESGSSRSTRSSISSIRPQMIPRRPAGLVRRSVYREAGNPLVARDVAEYVLEKACG